jgi:hypothetical protein
MEQHLIDIEKALASGSEESIAEWLERIRHELKLANALRIVDIKLTHSIGEKALNVHIEDANDVVNLH